MRLLNAFTLFSAALLAACPEPEKTTDGSASGTGSTSEGSAGTTTGASATDVTTTGVPTTTDAQTTGGGDTTTDASTDATTGDTGGAEFVVSGSIVGDLPNTPVKVVVLWSAMTPMGDGLYKFGEGTVSETEFSATIPGPLPPEALIGGELGVGFVALVPMDLDVPEGPVIADIEPQILGAATRDAVIWRPDADMLPGISWADAFPVGYACGDCVPPMDMMGFDEFVVGACDDLMLFVPLDEMTPQCNWT